MLVTLRLECLFRAGDEEERVVHNVGADYGLAFRRLFHFDRTELRQYDTIA